MSIQSSVTFPKQDPRLNLVKAGRLGNIKWGWQEFLIQHTALVKKQKIGHRNLVLEAAEACNADLPACAQAIPSLTATLAEGEGQIQSCNG